MEYRLLQNNLHDAHKVTKYCIGVCCGQFFVILMLVILSISLSHRSMVTLVPMNLNSPIEVSNNSISAEYLSQSALSFINLRLNFDPDTIDKNHQVILKFASTNSYPSLKKSLDTESSLVKEQGITSNFYVSDVHINRKNLSVIVSGRLIRSVSSKTLPSVNTKFQITFENNNGLLSVSKFVEEKQNG